MLCLSLNFIDNEHVFHNVELIFNKTMTRNNFLDFPRKIILLFSDLIFPVFSLTDRKFPDFLVKF